MPYEYCPTCRLTVQAADGATGAGSCPRCGAQLAQAWEPLGSPPRGPDPEAVRTLLAQRGGRFRRAAATRARGRFSTGSQRAA